LYIYFIIQWNLFGEILEDFSMKEYKSYDCNTKYSLFSLFIITFEHNRLSYNKKIKMLL